MTRIGDGYAMYWFNPIEIHSKQFRYLYTWKRGSATKAMLRVYSAICQYPICHADAIRCDLTWLERHIPTPVWSMVGLWLCCGRKHMVLVGNDNDKNAGFVGGIGVGEVFQRSSDMSPTKVAGGNGGTEQWWGGHHWRLRWSHPLIVLWKERDWARTMTITPNELTCVMDESCSMEIKHGNTTGLSIGHGNNICPYIL